jgi:hypothetical protein
MIDRFESLGQLMGHYRFIKADLTGTRTALPSKEFDIKKGFVDMPKTVNPRLSKSTLEEKFAFVCDVENFVKHFHGLQRGYTPITPDILLAVFHIRYSPETAKYSGYRHMASCMKRRRDNGESHLPKRLQYHSNLATLAGDMHEKAEEYFAEKGLITRREKRFTFGGAR